MHELKHEHQTQENEQENKIHENEEYEDTAHNDKI